MIENAVFLQLNTVSALSDLFNVFQSSALVNDIHLNTDSDTTSVMVLLDLSAAFNTVKENVLLEKLEYWVGLSGTVLNCFESCLKNTLCRLIITL